MWHKMWSCVTRSYLWHTFAYQLGFFVCKNSRSTSGVARISKLPGGTAICAGYAPSAWLNCEGAEKKNE